MESLRSEVIGLAVTIWPSSSDASENEVSGIACSPVSVHMLLLFICFLNSC